MKDESHAKAIIRRGITDFGLANKEIDKKIDKVASANSITKFYELLEKASDAEFQYSLVLKHQAKHHGKRRLIYYFYVDLFSSFEERKNFGALPASFDIRVRFIDTKRNLNSIEDNDDFSFFRLSLHCIQRIIQRDNCNSFIEALSIFSPICAEFLRLSTLCRNRRIPEGRYAVVIQSGYFILQHKNCELPMILTWVPKNRFGEFKLSKLSFLFKDNIPIVLVFTSEYFNSSSIVNPEKAFIKL